MYKNNLFRNATGWATHKGVLAPDDDEAMDGPVFPTKAPKATVVRVIPPKIPKDDSS